MPRGIPRVHRWLPLTPEASDGGASRRKVMHPLCDQGPGKCDSFKVAEFCTNGCTSFPAVLARLPAFGKVPVRKVEDAVYEVLAAILRALTFGNVGIRQDAS